MALACASPIDAHLCRIVLVILALFLSSSSAAAQPGPPPAQPGPPPMAPPGPPSPEAPPPRPPEPSAPENGPSSPSGPVLPPAAEAQPPANAPALPSAAPPVGPPPGPPPPVGSAPIRITRISGGIEVDGVLGEVAWQQAAPVDLWFETNPGDNTAPKVKSVGYLVYDDKYLYAGFEFSDPNPEAIRSPLRDRDNVPRDTDYGGVIIDPTNTGKTGIQMLANARGVQYDAIYDDSSGNEDTAPDFFWDASARIHDRGWTLELRIPFSSLRYPSGSPQTWRILLYRNYPRDFRYQFFSARLPRGRSCFICYSNELVGLTKLPTGGGLVFAPYLTGSYEATPTEALGSELEGSFKATAGFDAKWRPNASTVIDATVNPDFSQIESDVAQITANERFALSFPEKRPFFLEGNDLLATPISAVYTRTITDPLWGVRGTGRVSGLSYTSLVAQDEGGGSVIIPRSDSSEEVLQDFRSWVGIGRLRYDLGRSFVSLLATTRELEDGGHNRVLGPDFEWRLGDRHRFTGQALGSWTRTPERPELSPDWDGSASSGYTGRLQWRYNSPRLDASTIYQEVSRDFRADNGYVPQAGYREGYGELGYTLRPEEGLLRRVRPFGLVDRAMDLDNELLFQQLALGANVDARWSSTLRLLYAFDRIRVGEEVLPRHQVLTTLSVSPSMTFSRIDLTSSVGQQIDFANGRTGLGADVALGLTLQPTPHLELVLNESLRAIEVRSGGQWQRLFTARVDRLRATYSFNSRLFVRAIGQYEVTRRDPALYTSAVARKQAAFSGSALFAFKLNWQSVVFIGYGDNRVFSDETRQLEPEARQLFLKFSYAIQR